MNVPTNDTANTQVEAPPASESQSTPPQADSSGGEDTGAAPAGAGSPAPQAQPEAARPDGKDQKSLTPPIPVASNTQIQSNRTEPVSPEAFKRLRDEKSQWGREQAELRKQSESLRQQLAAFQQERERAAQAAEHQKLPLHDYRHPDHQTKFAPILAKADLVRDQLARIGKAPEGFTPEQAAAWQDSQRQAIMASLSADEQTALEGFQRHGKEFVRKLQLNPTQTLHEYVMPLVKQVLQQERQQFQAQQDVDRDLNDPQLKPILEKYREPMAEMIHKLGDTDEAYDMAKHHALVYADNERVYAENARLKQQLAEAGIKVDAAKTQRELAKGRASITKDVAPRITETPYERGVKWARESNTQVGSPLFFQKVREFEAQAKPH